MNSIQYILGFVTGLVIVLAISLITQHIIKKKFGKEKYDERQQLIRGNAYKWAFWVLISYLCFIGLLELATGIQWADLMTSSFIGICLSMSVFAISCIMNDAYFPINQKPKLYFVLFGIVITLNSFVVAMNILDKDIEFITDGKLNFRVMNIVVLVVFVAIFIALLIKKISLKKIEDRVEL